MIGSRMEGNENPRRILIVDDDEKLCRLIGDYLQPLGYDVSCRHTGTEGLEEARAGGYMLAEPVNES